MRLPTAVVLRCALLAQALPCCNTRHASEDAPPAATRASAPALPADSSWLAPRPVPTRSDAALAVERSLQARRLRLPPRREHVPRLAFGKGVLGQLAASSLRVYSTTDGSLVLEAPLQAPRALVTLADGALLALGGAALLRVEGKQVRALPRPVFLPGAELYADAVQLDRIWIFEGRRAAGQRPRLSSFRLERGEQKLLLPEQEIELEAPSGGFFGTTREGVWLYFGAERVERFGPGGARLKGFGVADLPRPFSILPTRRLDQAYLLGDDGQLTRALVTPLFRKLSQVDLGLVPFAAGVGDEGRLLAVIAVSGEGPSFELRLFDERLEPTGRTPLAGEQPTGRDDWVQVVTRNLELACEPRGAHVAVGGPDRAQIFDARGALVLSIPSR
jgi:hypothetical protein